MLSIIAISVSCETTADFDNDSLGRAQVHVRIAGDAAKIVDSVELTLSGVGIAPAIVHPMERESGSWFVDVSDIPVGVNNRIVHASAYDSRGDLVGEVSVEQVTIAFSRSAEIFLYLDTGVRTSPGSGGSTPVIDGLSTSSVEPFTNEVITLAVKAHAPGSNEALQYTWSADDGFFYNASSAIVSWNAPPRAGSYRIWVTVSNTTGKRVSKSLSVHVINVPEWSF